MESLEGRGHEPLVLGAERGHEPLVLSAESGHERRSEGVRRERVGIYV